MNIPTEKEASAIRRYFVEYVVFGLCFAVVTLFYLYYDMNKTVIQKSIQNEATMIMVIEKNTRALENLQKN